MENSLEGKKKEFEEHIWDHTQDPFQLQFDQRPRLSQQEILALENLVDLFRTGKSEKEIATLLRDMLKGEQVSIFLILQIAGLTRSKILSDLKAATPSDKKIPNLSAPERLVKNDETWEFAGPYLVKGLRRVLEPLTKCPDIQSSLEALNQATWPGYIRQERAKRQGHEAEARLAILLKSCDIPFEPLKKVENPLCSDVQIHGISFDLVIPQIESPLVCFKSTVHTSNIGQYGESKDLLEIEAARRMIDEKFTEPPTKPLLMALIDGVGFLSNREALEGVLKKVDEFCQLRTLWKAIIVGATRMKKPIKLYMKSEEIRKHKDFLDRYGMKSSVVPLDEEKLPSESVEAGEAFILPL
ncbi:MAG: hypothetical protein QXU75_08585 [Candidatus Methanomethylicaceae archaeon]